MRSRGIELSLSTKNIQTQDFSWTTDIIYSHMKNEVTKFETSTRASIWFRASDSHARAIP